MKNNKPIASLSFDLDDQWTYMKTHGDAGWETFPSYLDIVVPRVLQFLKERNLIITFFIVGQDAVFEKNHELLKSIADAGHEIANHSFNHDPWLHLYSDDKIEKEIQSAEEAIEKATGRKPVGFRGPGFSLSNSLLEVLAKRNYRYDATIFPNMIMPIARKFFLKNSNLTAAHKEQRKSLGGTFRDGFRSLKPHTWKMKNGKLVEIPVTTMPIFKLPIHMSYLLSLFMVSKKLATQYFQSALFLCKRTDTQPSFLLHPTDFLGSGEVRELSYFPGMKMPVNTKLGIVSDISRRLCSQFHPMTLIEHVGEWSKSTDLLTVQPNATVYHQRIVRS